MHQVETIEGLKGEELNAVCFVMDYVEFHFNGPVLRALSNPRITTPDGASQFPDAGSRDELCNLIGSTVVNVTVREEHSIAVELSGGRTIVVPLDTAHRIGPEAAHFVLGYGKDLRMSIW